MTTPRDLDDFTVGQRARGRARTVTESDVVSWAAMTWDTHPLHTDEVYAGGTQFGTRIAAGPMIFAFAVALQPADFFGDAVVAYLGVDGLRHQGPVRIGDTIRVEVEVVEARPRTSAPGGVLRVRCDVFTQHDERAMSSTMTYLVHGPSRHESGSP